MPEILNVRPEEAIRHFRSKGFHVGFDWRDTEASEHLTSFTVAKAMRLDILQDIRTAVDRALAEGRTFEKFQAELEPLLRRRGWWGRQALTDPVTGRDAHRPAGLAAPAAHHLRHQHPHGLLEGALGSA